MTRLLATLVIAFQYTRLSRRLDALVAERDQVTVERDESQRHLDRVDAELRELKSASNISAPADPITQQQTLARLSALEQKLQKLNRSMANRPSVAEYNPTEAPVSTHTAAPENPFEPRRQWSPEQAVGAPDTDRAGDHPTAWASLQPDAGPEWLQLQFDRAVEVSEVRIRESYNPGAITKVTAFVSGRDVSLWEGEAARGQAPRDFTIPAPPGVTAQSIVVHLDTTRVPGWNEIDAVELVGRDGSRQWASHAQASSTYAEQSVVQPFRFGLGSDR